MRLQSLTATTLFLLFTAASATAQDAAAVLAAASKAMGVDTLSSITYAGTARNGAFGQSKVIGEPMGAVNVTTITRYTRTLNFGPAGEPTALVSRATGPTQPPAIPGVAPQPAGVFNQNITTAQAGANWAQALNVWTTPWGFLKAAAGAGAGATVRRQGGAQIVSFSPANFKSPSGQPYAVTGYLDAANLVTKVETRVDNAVVGDLLVEFEYATYKNMNGVQVPTRIVQRQAGMQTFDATIDSATPNPPNLAELLTLPAPAAGAPAPAPPAPAAGAPPVEKLGEGAFKIGGNYAALAVDMGDHVLVVESGQHDARGLAVMAAAKQAVPGKPIRFVVNSHAHFDHAGGLGAAVAEGATILTHRNNEVLLERVLAGPRTLIGDSLAKQTTRRKDVVQAIGARDIRKGTNGKIVELHHVPNEHSDGMLVAYLPAEKVLWTADVTIVNPTPVQLATLKAVVGTVDRLKLEYTTWLPSHPPNPDRPLTRDDVAKAVGTTP